MSGPMHTVKVRLGDPEHPIDRLLKYNQNAFAEIQALIGKPVNAMLAGLQGVTPETALTVLGDIELRALLWAGIRCAGGPAVTVEEVGEIMRTDIDSQMSYINAVTEAIFIARYGKTQAEAATETAKQVEAHGEPPKDPSETPPTAAA